MHLGMIRITGRFPIDLPFIGARSYDPFVCKGVDGLDPPDTNVFISSGAFHNREVIERELVFNIGLNPTYHAGQSVSDLRTTMYGLLTPGGSQLVKVDILDDAGTLWGTATGVCKRVVAGIFNREPVVQVTISCLSPYIQGPVVSMDLTSLSRNTPRVVNPGNAPSPFRAELTFTSGRYGWYLRTAPPVSSTPISRIEVSDVPFIKDDRLIIDTRKGLMTIRRIREGVGAYLFAAMTSDSEFIQLFAGFNDFVTASGNFTWDKFDVYPNYWGV